VEQEMIIVAFADIHGDTAALETIFRQAGAVDLVLLLGDITQFGGKEAVRKVVEAVQPHCPRLLAVPGNCDYPEVEEWLSEKGLSLHRRHVILDGIGFAGAGLSLPCPGTTPGEISEHDFRQYLAEAAADFPRDIPMVLVTHEPPFNTVTDLAFTGEHVGSRAVRDFIETSRPMVCFTGHIHEAAGSDTIGTTRIINPGPLRRGGYVYAEIQQDGVRALEIRNVRHQGIRD
jgi:uncharacterized protein